MKLEEYLSPDEIREYKEQWKKYAQRYEPSTQEEVHSGIPVISKIYRFRDKNVFRAHVFSKRLRKFDPYHVADECLQHFWHGMHYFMVAEQVYTAAKMLLIGDEYNRIVTKEIPIELNWKKPIEWKDNVSVELVLEEIGRSRAAKPYERECCNFTIYSDKTEKILSRMKVETYSKPRVYVETLKNLKSANDQSIKKFIDDKINRQAVVLKKLKEPAKQLDLLVGHIKNTLMSGAIPEQEIHQLFDLWRKDK